MDRQIRVLYIGAHPDDGDFHGGGLLLKCVKAGHKVKILSMTDGSSGHQTMKSEPLKERRLLETQEVTRLTGIEYEVLGYRDGSLVADLSTREAVIRAIREYNPDVVVTHRTCDYHADHRNTALAVQDAAYLLIVPNVCPDTPPMEKNPVILFSYDHFKNPPFAPHFVVDTDDVVEQKFEMLACHVSQVYEWLPFTCGNLWDVPADPAARLAWLHEPRVPDGIPDAEILKMSAPGCTSEVREATPAAKYREKLIARYGEEKGRAVKFAEAYELSEYGSPLTAELEKVLFPF